MKERKKKKERKKVGSGMIGRNHKNSQSQLR
jgi:hypothetical protein